MNRSEKQAADEGTILEMYYASALDGIVEKILCETPNFEEAGERAHSMALKMEDYLKAFELSQPIDIHNEASFTPFGYALSPAQALNCLYYDTPRAVKFMGGLIDAVKEAQSRFPNEKIEILYAGSGPFASLALPLTRLFSDGEIRITALDYHQDSVKCLRQFAEDIGVSRYFEVKDSCDASFYEVPDDEKPHIVISETMSKALTSEPQAGIVINLAPQKKPQGILIPEEVRLSVEAVVRDESQPKGEGKVLNLGDVFTLKEDTKNPVLDATVDIPVYAKIISLRIATRVQIFGNLYLEPGESFITTDVELLGGRDLPPIDSNSMPARRELHLKYHLGTHQAAIKNDIRIVK